MRGKAPKQSSMLFLQSPEEVVPKRHPIRKVKELADAALRELSPVFDAMYAASGRDSVPPERLLKASILMALYSVRSERMFCEQLGYNLLFRWFLDMDMAEPRSTRARSQRTENGFWRTTWPTNSSRRSWAWRRPTA